MRFPIPLRARARRLAHSVASWAPYARGGAWFFVLFSLAHLAWVAAVKWEDPAGLTTLYQTTVPTLTGEVTHRAWGLAYDGTAGLLLALTQAAAVLAAAVLSVRGRRRLRRIAHGVLIAWAGLWMADLIHLAGVDGQLDSAAQASVAAMLFGCTVFRALRPGRPKSRGSNGPVGEDVLSRDSVVVSARMLEIDPGLTPPRGEDAPADDAPDAVRRAALRAVVQAAPSNVKRGCRVLGRRCAPVATACRRRGSEAGRRAVAYLRAKGVIPTPHAPDAPHAPHARGSHTDVGRVV